MKTHTPSTVHRLTFRHGSASVPLLLGALLLSLSTGCGPVEEPSSPPPHLGNSVQELADDNGLVSNGLAMNGLAMNGLAMNGLAMNGLATSSFSTWFQQNPSLANLFMKYLVRCSVSAGQTRTYSDGVTTYTWYGDLGLAPNWSSGAPATLQEQQVVTGCLLSLVNKYGRNVNLSVLGSSAQGQPIPYSTAELTEFSQREACFFGNLFNNEGLFVGNDQPLLPVSKSSLRACALSSANSATSSACPPLTHVGSCQSSCQLDPTNTYYTQCWRNGVAYQPITTRIRTQEIVTCGDGICQPSESCGGSGSGNRADDCGLDCGACK
jgi:hypothetical protein